MKLYCISRSMEAFYGIVMNNRNAGLQNYTSYFFIIKLFNWILCVYKVKWTFYILILVISMWLFLVKSVFATNNKFHFTLIGLLKNANQVGKKCDAVSPISWIV